MVVYGYKPDTLVAIYPALQGTDTSRRRIFKNAAVYLGSADFPGWQAFF